MSHCYNYAIAQLCANPVRAERLNLGLVVFNEDRLEVFPGRNLEKVRAISSALNVGIVELALSQLPSLYDHVLENGASTLDVRLSELASFSPIGFSALGQFFARDADSFNLIVERLVKQLVDPEPAPARVVREKKTKLLASVKSAFKSEKILARKGEGLESHRVVVNEELAIGLSADLMLKNGLMHVLQTVDASHSDRARKAIQEIGTSALIFEQARMNFGPDLTAPRLVYSANASLEKSIGGALAAAEHQGATLVNWDSRDDRIRFIVDISSLANPLEDRSTRFSAVNASVQHRFRLN